jgi:hypothetical protein
MQTASCRSVFSLSRERLSRIDLEGVRVIIAADLSFGFANRRCDMRTAWLVGGVVLTAVGFVVVAGGLAVAQGPTRQVGEPPGVGGGGGEQPVQINRQQMRRVLGGPGGEPQLDQQTGQFRIQRQTVREGLRRLPVRLVGRWRLGVDVENAPKGLRIEDVARNSPAYRFGLEPGDYLLDVMGYPVGFYGNAYYPLGEALNQLVRRDGWVNILVWNKRTNGEEAMWIQLEPRGGIVVPFGAPGESEN